jgi:hypothetical protein
MKLIKKRILRKPILNIGFISLLMIIMTLCLSVFVALSITSAAADRNLTERTGETTIAFYGAQNKFQTLLRDLDTILLTNNIDDIGFGDLLHSALARSDANEFFYDADRQLLSAQWPAGERLLINTEIQINSDRDTRYEVLSFVLSPVQEKLDTPLNNVWKGEELFYDNQ